MINILTMVISALFILGAFICIISTIYHTFTGRYLLGNDTKGYLRSFLNYDIFDSKLKSFLLIMIMVLVSRLLLFLITSLISWLINDFTIEGSWFRWDAHAYQRIANNGYVTTGVEKYDLVFFPMYSILIRLLTYITKDSITSAYIISNACLIFSAYFLYLIAKLDFDQSTSYRTVIFYLIYPLSFFLMVPMSESVFMMFLFGGIYFARTKRWLLAGVFGFFCTLTRMPGLVIAVPIFIEMVADSVHKNKKRRYASTYYDNPTSNMISKIFGFLMIPMGFVVYLFINYRVTGSFFTFMDYQKENWYNQAQPFTETLKTSFSYLLSPYNQSGLSELMVKLGVWIPNILSFVLGVLILWYGIFKLRPSYMTFQVFYMIVAYAASWLLSGGRYMIAAFPIYICFALIAKSKPVNILLSVICVLALIFNSCIYFMYAAFY